MGGSVPQYTFTSRSYCKVPMSVPEDKQQALVSGLSLVIDAKQYNNLLIAPPHICTLYIARYLTSNIGISMKFKVQYIEDLTRVLMFY